jgi:hypothetical protein
MSKVPDTYWGNKLEFQQTVYDIVWSVADQGFIGSCNEYPSMSYYALTLEETYQGIKKMVEEERRVMYQKVDSGRNTTSR